MFTLCENALEMKEYVHSEKFMDVDDLEVSDEDGAAKRSEKTERVNLNETQS